MRTFAAKMPSYFVALLIPCDPSACFRGRRVRLSAMKAVTRSGTTASFFELSKEPEESSLAV